MKRQQEGTLEGLKALAAYARQHPEMDEMKIMKMLIDYCISIGDAKAESMSQEELFTGLTNFIASKKNESTKGNSMKKLSEKELDLLEALMLKEGRAKKAGKKLSLDERVKLAVLKRALKRQVEDTGVWDDAAGPTGGMDVMFPNEDTPEGGYDTDAIHGSENTLDMPQTTLVRPVYDADGEHGGKMESSRKAKIKAIEQKLARLKSMKEEDYGSEEDLGMGDMGEMDDAEESVEQTVADALRGAADALSPEMEDETGEEEMMGDSIGGDEDLADVMESVRARARARREKLAQIRKNRLGEENTDVGADSPVMMDQPEEDILLGVMNDINNRDAIVSEAARAKKVEAIKRRIADRKAQKEAEVKTYSWNGTPKTNEPSGKRPWDGMPKNGLVDTQPARYLLTAGMLRKDLLRNLTLKAY
jgi:hypothetical protein